MPPKTLSIYKGAKGIVCARTRVTGRRKPLYWGEIKIVKKFEFADSQATIARAEEKIHHGGTEGTEKKRRLSADYADYAEDEEEYHGRVDERTGPVF